MTIRIDITNKEGKSGKIAIVEVTGKPTFKLHPAESATIYIHSKSLMWVREDGRKNERRNNRWNRRK